MAYTITILEKYDVTEGTDHPTIGFTTTKPEGFSFEPGQAIALSLEKEGWTEEKRPFTIVSRPEEDVLKFIIKIYPEHDSVTNQIQYLDVNDTAQITEPHGSLTYQGEGIFIAGGTGVNPFLCIGRHLKAKGKTDHNVLILSNRRTQDIIEREELDELFTCHFFVTREESDYINDHISKEDLEDIFAEHNILEQQKPVYICGTEEFDNAIKQLAEEIGATNIIIEQG